MASEPTIDAKLDRIIELLENILQVQPNLPQRLWSQERREAVARFQQLIQEGHNPQPGIF